MGFARYCRFTKAPVGATRKQPAASPLVPEASMKLTANAVKALTCDKADAIFFDDELKGFGYRVRVCAGGKVLRSWIVQYRHGLGHRRMTVGSAVALTAEQARGKAKELLAKVALGDDPQGDRRGRRDKHPLTLPLALHQFLPSNP